MLQQQIMQELNSIPENKLAELYDVIHYFCLGVNKEQSSIRKAGLLKGSLSDSFLSPHQSKNLPHGSKYTHSTVC